MKAYIFYGWRNITQAEKIDRNDTKSNFRTFDTGYFYIY